MKLGVEAHERVAAFDAAVDRIFDAVRKPAVDQVAYRLSSAADHSLLWHTCGIARAIGHGGDFKRAARSRSRSAWSRR